jgi:hypothetical protein
MKESTNVKLVVFVPIDSADKVRQVMGDAGAGKIGNYSHCSFSMRGHGTFLPREGANPAVGEVGKLEVVEEERIEIICSKELLGDVIAAMKVVHPYEEVAFDIYDLIEL